MDPRKHRANSAISTILANLLMVLVVASLGATLFTWSNATYSFYQSETDSFLSARAEKIEERYVTEQVWFVDTNSNGLKDRATLYVRNAGDLSVILVDIYVNGTRTSANSTSIGPGQVVPITIQLSPEPPANTVLAFVVVTQRGNSGHQNWTVI